MLRLRALSIGPIAAEILSSHHDVEVLAVFDRSFYLLTEGGLVCVGAQGIGHGPINVPLGDSEAIDWRMRGISAEVKGHSHADELLIGDEVVISLANAARWQPPPWPEIEAQVAVSGIATLRREAAGRLPREGLSPLVLAGGELAEASPEARAAADMIRDLRHALPGVLVRGRLDPGTVRSLTLLLGLGPGLTPSGDDLIGGMLLALSALQRTDLRDAIWEALAPELGDLTTEISAMHLSAAADGLGAEAIHRLCGDILVSDARALRGDLDRVARIGHCSGWDTIAGFVLLLDVALAAPAA